MGAGNGLLEFGAGPRYCKRCWKDVERHISDYCVVWRTTTISLQPTIAETNYTAALQH